MLRACLYLLLAGLTAAPAWAGESPWVGIAPDARLRLISSDTVSGGKTLAALEIDMPDNMKTYWRIPGETGIPVAIDLAGSSGVGGHEIIWPYPRRERKDGYVDFVYYGHTILPLELMVDGQDPHVQADVTMGICTDICVPVRAELALPLDPGTADRASALRIRQAMALAPIAYEGGSSPVGDVMFSAAEQHLRVRFDPALTDANSIIPDTGDPAVLFSLPKIAGPDGDMAIFEPLGRRARENLAGQPLRITFLTTDGAYRVTRIVGTADPQ